MNTYESRKAYIEQCERVMAADQVRNAAMLAQHEARAAEIQKAIDAMIAEWNAPLIAFAELLRLSKTN